MLDFFDKFSETSYKYKDKRCWPIVLKTSKNMIFNTLEELIPTYEFNNFEINKDFGECYFEQDDCEITLTLVNSGPCIQINISIFSNKIGKTFKKLKQINRLLVSLFEGFVVDN